MTDPGIGTWIRKRRRHMEIFIGHPPICGALPRSSCRRSGTTTYTLDPAISEADALDYSMNPAHKTHVAEDEGVVLGTFYLKANQAGGAVMCAIAADTMLRGGARVAASRRAMGERSIELARMRGFRAMQFNFVVSTNAAAVHLWLHVGFPRRPATSRRVRRSGRRRGGRAGGDVPVRSTPRPGRSSSQKTLYARATVTSSRRRGVGDVAGSSPASARISILRVPSLNQTGTESIAQDVQYPARHAVGDRGAAGQGAHFDRYPFQTVSRFAHVVQRHQQAGAIRAGLLGQRRHPPPAAEPGTADVRADGMHLHPCVVR
ncbi:N-acetyltransferase family protein [Sphingomonas sp. MMS24-JH45]